MRALFIAALTPAALLMGLAVAGPAAAELVVPIDHSVRLAVSGQAASVVIGNPQVADVTVVNSHTLFVSGRGYGETDVVVLDHMGRTIYSGDVIVAAGGNPLSALAGSIGGAAAGGASSVGSAMSAGAATPS